LVNSIEEKKKLIDNLPQKEATLANLELNVSLEEQKYILVSKELQEMEITASKDLPEIKVIQKAVAPLYPFRPIKVYHAILAGILSLFVGVGVALLKENMNTNVRSVREAEELLSMKVLMTVPKLKARRKFPWLLMEQGRKELPEVNRKQERAYIHTGIKIKAKKILW